MRQYRTPNFFFSSLILALIFLVTLSSASAATFYSYQSGNWATASNWTTDPSGTTLTGSAVPGATDQVTILNGRSISTSVSRTVTSLVIEGGATLDLGATTGHNFGVVTGQGILRLSTTTFPAGTFTSFVSSSGGTIEYYNVGGTGANLPTQTTYNNLIFTNATSTNHRLNIQNGSNPTNYTINGNLTLQASGTGVMTLAFGSVAFNSINYNVGGTVNVGSNCSFIVSNQLNTNHTLTITGDLYNNGIIDFANATQYNFLSLQGHVNVVFTGSNNSLMQCNGQTDVYTLGINKGTDPTYLLSVQSDNLSNFKFFTAATGLLLNNGTMRLGENISLNRINAGITVFEISSSGTGSAGLWIDGATMDLSSGCLAVGVYGLFRITAGTFSIGQEGLIARASADIRIEGGTVNAEKVRSSLLGGVQIGSFSMTGGVLNVNATLSGSSDQDSPRFSWPYPGQGFTMSGGTINIADPETGTAVNGGILIGCNVANVNITGGTWNVTIPASSTNFNICSTAPFYDLNISKAGVGTGTVILTNQTIGPNVIETYRPNPVSAQPLVVLHNLTILSTNSPVLNASSMDVKVGNNFMINSGSTYITGTNTTIFNGNSPGSFTCDGTISGGLNNLEIAKASSQSLTLSGSSSYTVNSNLLITGGILNDNGRLVQVAGNIINNGTHSGSGSITLNGSGAQSIGGNGNGVFQNFHLDKTTGSSILTANQTIYGNLRLANTAAILDIGVYRLTLGATAQVYDAITGTGTSFSVTRMIRNTGLSSDLGIQKVYTASAPSFTFPCGTASDYTPASIGISGTPTTWGSINTRPVSIEHPNVTTTGRSLTYYWKTFGIGINLGTATTTQSYQYATSDVVTGSGITENEYVPGRYNLQLSTWTSGVAADVDESTNTATFQGATFNNQIDGEYTAGDNNPIDPFGPPQIFYSIQDGDWNDTNPITSPWSNVSHTGPPSAFTPGAGSVVIIGDGGLNDHVISVTSSGINCGNLRISEESVLDIGTTIGHNFGTVTNPSGASGLVRVSSTAATAVFPGGDWALFFGNLGGTVEYYTSSTSFTIPTTNPAPYSVSLASYRNLILTTSSPRSITLPNLSLTILEDLTMQTPGAGGVVLSNSTASHSLSIGDDFTINGGTYRMANDFANIITCNGDMIVGTSGLFEVFTSGTVVANTLSIGGSLTNNGIFDLDGGGGRTCALTFTGNSNALFTGTNGSAVTTLNALTVNKGSSQTPVLTLNVAGTISTLSNNWLSLINGTLSIERTGTFTLTNAASTNFIIPATSCLRLNHSTGVVNIAQAASDNSDLILSGSLMVYNGVMNIGIATNNTNNDIEYSAAGVPLIDLRNAGILNVNGQIRRGLFVTVGGLIYSQSGTSLCVIRGRNANTSRGKFEIMNTGSSFNMSDNAQMTIVRGGGSGIFGDVYLRPASYSVSGGTFFFEQGNINTNYTYLFDSSIPVFNITINGTDASDLATLQLQVNPLVLLGTLTINNQFSIFNAAGFNVDIAGNLVNLNTDATAGLTAGGYRAATASQVTTFNSTTSNQSITGTSGNLTNFAHLVIDNSFTSGTVTLSSNSAIRVQTLMQLNTGTLADGGNPITVTGNIYNASSHISSLGGSVSMSGSSTQIISGDNLGEFGNLTLNNTSNVTTEADIRVNGILTFTNGLLNIESNLLTLGPNASISGTLSSARMIRTDGVLSDSGVVKLFNAGTGNFTIPIGVNGKYTPVSYVIGANTAPGSIQVKPVNAKHPATTDAAALELNYYWSVRGSGFSGLSLTQTYSYLDSDVNGTEASYRGGVYISGAWSPINGVIGAVNAAANTITHTGSSISADYTAGQSTEFASIPILYSVSPGGDWNNVNTWSTIGPAGPATGPIPSVHPVIITGGHTVTSTTNAAQCAILTLNGTLDLGTTVGHNFGTVSGSGTMLIASTANGNFVYPGGNYSSFSGSNGGTVEYYGSTSGSLFPQAYYHNLVFSGSSQKDLSLVNLVITGDVDIQSGVVNNKFSNTIRVAGDWTNNASSTAYIPGTGNASLTFNGASQNIGGTFSTTFNKLIIAGSSTKTLGRGIVINDDLTISSALDVSSSDWSIDVKGDWINNGSFSAQNGTVILNGNSANAQVIKGTSTSTFNNLTLSNTSGAALGKDATLKNTLTCSSGTFTTTGYNFTLSSSSTLTGRIAPLSSGNFNGELIMQRFAPGGLTGWAHLGTPVTGAKMIQWTDDFPTSGFTGSTGNVGSFVSIWSYDETAGGTFDDPSAYIAVTSAYTDEITAGKGYWVYLGTGQINTNDILIDVKGPARTGVINLNIDFTNTGSLAEDGWNLISNPYPSAIDWDAAGWTKTNMDDAVYVWQADLAQYASYVGGVGTNGGDNLIASSQGFYVKANATNPVLIGTENVKTAAQPALLRTNTKTSKGEMFRMILTDGEAKDEAVLRFENSASTHFDNRLEAFKLYSRNNALPAVSLFQDGSPLAILALPDASLSMEIPIEVRGMQGAEMHLSFAELDRIGRHVCMVFKDQLTGYSNDIRAMVNGYSFTQIQPADSDRFYLTVSIAPEIQTVGATCKNSADGALKFNNANGLTKEFIVFNENNQVIESFHHLPSGEYQTRLAAGSYRVVFGMRNACESLERLVTIDEGNSSPVLNLIAPSQIDVDEDVHVSVSDNNEALWWNFGDDSEPVFAKEFVHRYNTPGVYSISCVQAEGDCAATASQTIEVVSTNPDEEVYLQRNQNAFMIRFDFTEPRLSKIELLNQAGQVLSATEPFTVENGQREVSLEGLSKGIYLIRVQGGQMQKVWRVTKE